MMYKTYKSISFVLWVSFLHLFLTTCESTKSHLIWIDGDHILHETSPLFPSVALESYIFSSRWIDHFNDTQFMTLVKAFGPSYLRLGGTKNDFVHYLPDENIHVSRHDRCSTTPRDEMKFNQHRIMTEELELKDMMLLQTFDRKNITLSSTDWVTLNEFCKCVGWNLVFALNLQTRNGTEWNSENAQKLIDFTENKYQISWELGNEPNSYRHKLETQITPEQNAEGFMKLKQLLNASSWWNQSRIIGPDVNNMHKVRSLNYLETFLQHAESAIDVVTFHEYNFDGHTAKLQDFIDVKYYSSIQKQVYDIFQVVNKFKSSAEKVWLGETSAAYGGGAKNLSSSFVDGFMWLDKLGQTARMGVDNVIRQAFFGGNYGLLDYNFDPRPDYWLTLLYKRLVGHKVLQVLLKEDELFRVYCHCTNNVRSRYPKGSATVYFLNLNSSMQSFYIENLFKTTLFPRGDMYLLESGAPGVLNSPLVRLNGKVISMPDESTIPPLEPRKVTFREFLEGVTIPSYSFGFLILSDVRFDACS